MKKVLRGCPGFKLVGDRLSPWIAGQVGTNLFDPMFHDACSWVPAIGFDLRFMEAAPVRSSNEAACLEEPCLFGLSREERS